MTATSAITAESPHDEVLHQFFAVTLSGHIYEINDQPGSEGWPEVVRI